MVSIEEKVAVAKQAMKAIEGYSQDQVDQMLSAVSKTIFMHAEELAEAAVAETGLGNVPDKIGKNQNMATNIFAHLKGKRSVGVINHNPGKGLIEVAHPVGVIGSVTPTTNPTITPLGNGLMALKGKNAMIVSPHPRAKKTTTHTIELMRDALVSVGAPKDLLQVIEAPTLELSQKLMSQSDVIIATGGPGLVSAAYSSGKPAYGVGPGNVQVILDDDFEIELAAELTVIGRSFDNGIVCACQQSLIYPEHKEALVFDALRKHGAFVSEKANEVAAIRKAVFPEGVTNPNLIGVSAMAIALAAGLEVPETTEILAVKVEASGKEEPLCKEKMSPVLALISYKSFDEAIQHAKNNLLLEGAGHSAGIFSMNDAHILMVGEKLPVSRVVVNQPSIDAGGSPENGLNPTVSLGCGSWGNNIISENLTFKHLINVSRIAYKTESSMKGSPWD